MTTEILKECTVKGNAVMLPARQLDRKIYQDVASKLEGIGGKWNRKAGGFMFDENPAELLAIIQTGQTLDLKKEFQFFPTPPDLALWAMGMLTYHVSGEDTILEPSAGRGALIKAFRQVHGVHNPIDAYELMPLNQKFLEQIPNVNVIGDDFTQAKGIEGYYDLILANPPFTGGQDVEHIEKMYAALKVGGTILTFCSTSWKHNSHKRYERFRGLIDQWNAEAYPVPKGAFKSSGTMVETTLFIIEK